MGVIIDKILATLIVIIVLFSNKYNYAYSENLLVINDDIVSTHENMYTINNTNYINIDLLINSGLDIKREKTRIPMVSMISNDKGYMLLLNSNIIANTLIDKKDILKINDNIFVAAKVINNIDSNYIVEWNSKYKLLRIKKNDNSVTDDQIALKYPKEFGIYQIDGVFRPINPTKFAYLTFDDGPSKNVTPTILDVLKETGCKATFFINGVNVSGKENILKRIVNEGHTIGNHSYSHKSSIYNSLSEFRTDLEKNEKLIYDITGYECSVFRAPYGKNLNDSYKSYLKDNGYMTYYWNVDPGDSTIKNVTAQKLINNVAYQIKNKQDVIIILHDMSNKEETAKSIKGIIKLLWENGYDLRPIDNSVKINSNARVF